ncbi:hypothetical protein ABS71_07180 [bacterium SCN 62-11]|nr:MAG: hypothetical protein ABS71_07180 [bacterium SCN 62-11]
MVLAVQGKVSAYQKPVVTGQLLDDSSVLDLPGGSSVTLLVLNKGERVAVSGQGRLQLSDQGVQVRDGATLRVIDSNQQKLSLNGENHRTIGGMTTRSLEVGRTVLNSTSIDRVEVREGQGLMISRPAGTGSPPSLTFRFTPVYKLPEVVDGKPVCLLPDKDVYLWSPVVPGQRVGSRWQWEVGWPKEDLKTMGLVITEADEPTPLLYTWVYQTSPEEEEQLRTLGQEVKAWSQREPKSVEPMVVFASVLEDRGFLERAVQQIDQALALKNDEPGLLEMKARVLTELGRYAEADQLLAR